MFLDIFNQLHSEIGGTLNYSNAFYRQISENEFHLKIPDMNTISIFFVNLNQDRTVFSLKRICAAPFVL